MAAMLRTGLSHEHAAALLRDTHRTFVLAAVGTSWRMTDGSFERPSLAATLLVCC
jgi:hypothetical protein